jgi:asparagine synthase (glutamine-hydrolysing)
MYTEPFADSSQIPVHLVSALARKHVTVSLSGDAGDELFAGYNRYILGQRHFRQMQRIPRSVRHVLSGAMGSISPANWAAMSGRLPGLRSLAKLSEKAPKIAQALAAEGPEALYADLVSLNRHADSMIRPDALSLTSAAPASKWSEDFVSEMMRSDLVTYLPDDILCKVDRAAMAVSLETRVPMLDHEVIEFAWSLPLSIKLRDGIGKWPLRQLLYRHVPRELIERPKMGFAIPLDEWLRGPLRDWAESLLNGGDEDALNNTMIAQLWESHCSGRGNHGSALWPVLTYRSWRHSLT